MISLPGMNVNSSLYHWKNILILAEILCRSVDVDVRTID